MPEHRSFPYKYFPKLGIKLGVTFGEPIPAEDIAVALSSLYPESNVSRLHVPRIEEGGVESELGDELHLGGWVGRTVGRAGEQLTPVRDVMKRKQQVDLVRSDVTAIIQQAVEALGRQVSGNHLNKPLMDPPTRS
jgi:monolysocardiolipin acyltransferase